MYDAENYFAVQVFKIFRRFDFFCVNERDGNREKGYSMRKIHCAVERVDDPNIFRVWNFFVFEKVFFGKNFMVGIIFFYLFRDEFFGGFVGVCHKIVFAFFTDLYVIFFGREDYFSGFFREIYGEVE